MDITASEFPFVDSLPEHEAERILSRWERFKEYIAAIEAHGPPVPPTLAAELLGVSRARVYEIIAQGRLTMIEMPNGQHAVAANSLVKFANLERKGGRPTLLETSSVSAKVSPKKNT